MFIKNINSTLSIYFLVLSTCSFAYSQGHQPADEHWHKAQDLKKQGRYIDTAKMYEKSAETEKENPDPGKSNLVTDLNQAGYYYSLAGQYKKAVKYLEEALAVAGKMEQEDKVATCLNCFGSFYKSLGQYDVAIKYYLEALDIDRELEREDNVAIDLNYIGNIYKSWGQYDTAIEYFEGALDKNKKNGMKDKVTVNLNNIGGVYETLGKYNVAIEYYEEALDIARKLWHDDKISTGLNNIGNIYKSWGQYDTAIKYYEEALDIHRKLWQEDIIVSRLNYIGDVCKSSGQYDRAIEYYEEALDIDRKRGKEDKIATCLNNIGGVNEIREEHDIAIKYYEEALAIDRKLEQKDKVSTDLNNIGRVYETMGQHDTAIGYYEKALDIDRRLEKEADDALSLKNLDMVYRYYWSKHDKVINPYEQALATDKKFGKDADISRDLNNIGMIYVLQKEYKTAIEYFKESVSLIERLRQATDGEERRDYLARQIHAYQLLASAYIGDNDISSAFQIIELSRAKLLTERFGGSEWKIRPQEVHQIQKTLDADTAIIVYANVNRKDIIQFVITRDEFTGKEVSRKSFVQSSIDKYHIPISTLLITQHNLSENNNDFDNIINYYGSLLMEPSLQDERGWRVGVKELRKSHKANAGEIGRGLYELLIKPMEAQIKDKKNLIIVPGGILAFVPFETLMNENGQYLVENHHINYVQSVDIRKLIKKRKYGEKRRPLLAFGGAVYEEATYNVDVIENKIQMALLKKNIYSDLSYLSKLSDPSDPDDLRSFRNVYSALGIGSWCNLPDTLSEVNNIKNVINRSNIFTGMNVTEKEIKALSRNWTLYNYKVLHFATHGLAVPAVPELSAVVLSQFEKDMGKEDGYLRTEEIAELDLQADLVTLSACETGLGRIYGDAGIFGLTQSFILAGANAVSISLWRVASESTSQFMTTMYGMVQEEGIGYAEAITEVKRQFISGNFGEKYKAPYYWAPFVYYGR